MCSEMPECGSKTSMVQVVWANLEYFGAIEMISCRDWWPWTKPGYITMTRRQSNNQLSGVIAAYSAPPQKVPSAKIHWKSSRSIFWDQDAVLLIDYLTKGQTINAVYYSSLLVQLKNILKEKRRGKATKGFLFLHDNSPAHQALATQKKLAYLGFQYLDHTPYSPDRAPSVYHLFPALKKQFKICLFSFDAEVIAIAETWLDGKKF